MARASEIEYRVLNILTALARGDRVESNLVELKREFPDPYKAARRIAALCNSAGGEDVLWIIGVDEADGQVYGPGSIDLAQWWPQVCANFDELAPSLIDLLIPFQGSSVMALNISSERAPFVIRNPFYGQSGAGPVSLEVPWRDATTTRSARRSDLLRILVPVSRLPSIEVLSTTFGGSVYQGTPGEGDQFVWSLYMTLYAVPLTPGPVVIPFHRCSARVELDGYSDPIKLGRVEVGSYGAPHGRQGSPNIEYSISEVILNGPGKLDVRGREHLHYHPQVPGPTARLRFQLRTTAAPLPITIDARLTHFGEFKYRTESAEVFIGE